MKTLIIAIALFAPLLVHAKEWSGKVVGISDGDTLTVLSNEKKPIRIRLVQIDAPEKTQDFGERAKQSLSDLCFNKTAKVDDKGQDRYQRTLGRVYCEGIDVNAEQVKRGMAWAYRQYLTDPAIADLEQAAKSQMIGLWSGTNGSLDMAAQIPPRHRIQHQQTQMKLIISGRVVAVIH